MTIHELTEGLGLTFAQQNEVELAYEVDPAGVERLVKKARNANNPPAALISMVRKMSLVVDVIAEPAFDLDGATNDCLRIYNARVAKYPPTSERGWTDDDAIVYAIDCVRSSNSRFEAIDLERSLRIRIGKPWNADQDPALKAPGGAPPNLLHNILTKVGKIGSMPDGLTSAEYLAAYLKATGRVEKDPPRRKEIEPVATPEPTPEPTLAERLLAMTGRAA